MAQTQDPQSLAEFEALASQRLDPVVFDFFAGGSMDEITLRNNRACLERIAIRPRVLNEVHEINTRTKLMGCELSAPILVAPMAFQCLMHPDGELATVRAAAGLGMGMVLSTVSTQTLEDVANAISTSERESVPLWLQLYYFKDKKITQDLVERAHAAGYTAICLTVDQPVLLHRKSSKTLLTAFQSSVQQKNLLPYVTPEDRAKIRTDQTLMSYLNNKATGPNLNWKDLEWLMKISPIPIVLKGVLHPDDAVKASKLGIKTIIVSNHGGRQLDGAISTIDALAEIKPAVGDTVDLLMDGGIRRGTDIFKALALGAKAVLVGRPVLWGLAFNGQDGARQVLNILETELTQAMALSGCANLTDIHPGLIKM
jgi:4-hydroxymandelate oxidase